MSTALEIARAFEAAWQRRDMDAARAYLADDVMFDSPFGRESGGADGVISQYAGFVLAVTGPVRELAAFGDEQTALIMRETPTSMSGPMTSTTHYAVSGGRIVAATLVYDATPVKVAAQAHGVTA
jgi:ketosteroid isomerase-like protein